MDNYDCTNDVMEHKGKVRYWLQGWINVLHERMERHDDSKLYDPVEKAMFDTWTLEQRCRAYIAWTDKVKAGEG